MFTLKFYIGLLNDFFHLSLKVALTSRLIFFFRYHLKSPYFERNHNRSLILNFKSLSPAFI
jgi:hypothetical protein